MNKKILSLMAMMLTLLAFTSCNDHDYDLDKLVPDAYKKIAYIKNYGTHDLLMYTTQENYIDSLIVIKAGSDPATTQDMRMDVLSQAAVDTIYNELLGTNYKVLPSEAYSLVNGTDIHFDSGQEGQYYPVNFNPAVIYKLANADPESQYVLPLQLSSDKDSINADMNRAIYVIDVKSPVLGFGATEIADTMVYKSLQMSLPLVINNSDRNTSDIDLTLDVSGQATAVADFNALHGTSYKLLPSSSYTIENLSIAEGALTGTATLNISRSGLENDATYILPLKIASSSMGDKMQNDSVYAYAIVSVPTYATRVIDPSNCKAIFCNNDNAIGGWYDNAGINSIFDGNANSYWHSGWQLNYAGDSDDYNYGYTDHHSFKCCRYANQTIVVIDMGSAHRIVGVNARQRSGAPDSKDAIIYVSNDSEFKFTPVNDGGNIADYNRVALNNWTRLMDVEFAYHSEWQHFDAPSDVFEEGGVKGRFVKVHFQSSWRYENLNMAEFRLVELIAINGEPVE